MLSLNYAALDSGDKKYIRFPDPNTYQDMFLLEDGKKLLFHDSYDHTDRAVTCKYIDPYHFYFGSTVFHIHQFAELMQRNGHTYDPLNYVTDFTPYLAIIADRDLKDEDGKHIRYHVLAVEGNDPYHSAGVAFCPEAPEDRQIFVYNHGYESHSRFCSCADLLAEAFDNGKLLSESSDMGTGIAIPGDNVGQLILTPHEHDLIIAAIKEHTHNMPHITQAEYDAIGNDYKGPYHDYYGDHHGWKGRRTAFLPGYGTKLFIEGISFVIDDGKSLDKQINKTQEKQDTVTDKFSYEDAKKDILSYLSEQENEYFEERGRSREDVLQDTELIDSLAAEHLKCVNNFGNDREWSCKDACDSDPGIEREENEFKPSLSDQIQSAACRTEANASPEAPARTTGTER